MVYPRFVIIGLLLLGLSAAIPAAAADAPTPWVGRIAVVEGNLSLRPSGGEWTDSAEINEPVAAAMSLRTGSQGRALLRIGAETIALAPGTELDLAQLDTSGTQVVLRRGRVGVRLSTLDSAHSIEIDVPRGGIWLLTPGDYDIAAGEEHAPTRLAALDGRARFVGKGLDTVVATGSTAVLNGNDPVAATLDGAASDEFVAWWRPAAGDADAPPITRVSAEISGSEQLDANGDWETIAGYGAVWFPKSVANDWAPYRYGHWRWLPPWGWTWIDDAAWGFAPSHYGRWAKIPGPEPGSERWGWVPGELAAHPLYMPAAVAFLGTPGVGLSYPDAFAPAVAWFPLAPGELYWPSYTDDLEMIRRINAGSGGDFSAIVPGADKEPPAAIVNADYHNRRFASVVPRPIFLGGQTVAPALLKLPEVRLDNAPLLAGSPQIAPSPPRATAVAGASARLLGAVQTLARMLEPHPAAAPGRAAILSRAHAWRAAVVLAVARRQHALVLSGSRPRLVVAVASHGSRPRLRLAATRRAWGR